MGNGKHKIERVAIGDADSRAAEITAVLRYYLRHPERLAGLMLIAETDGGGFEMKYTGTSNVAERIGRLEILKDAMLEDACEDGAEPDWSKDAS